MYPRETGSAWEVYAPAKLNLYLEVLGKRADGFHELETLMAPIRLYDRLQWRPNQPGDSGSFSFSYDRSTPVSLQATVPADQTNLVHRAVERLASAAGISPFGRFILTKRIPAQSGMGGGSSDAAAALLLANAAWNLKFSRDRLGALAAELGSDIPFFLAGGSAICRGRGEQVEPLGWLPRLNVVVVAPPQGVPTAAAFGLLNAGALEPIRPQNSRSALDELLGHLRQGSIAHAARRMTNSLQSVALQLCPWIARVGAAFASTSCHAHALTGSGSAYFGIMRSARHARRAAVLLSSANLGTVYASATCR